MRVVFALTLGVALAAIAVAVLAMRYADRSRQISYRTETRLARYTEESARYRGEVRMLERRIRTFAATKRAVSALCYAARHASVPKGSNYALSVGRSIVRGIADSCDYATIPDVAASKK